MSDEINNKPSTAYWVIAATLLAWNLLGLYMYYGQSTATPESFANAGYSADQVNFVMAEPVWAHAAYAIAVNAGVLGAILLLLRKAWAVPLFVLSLIGALLQDLDAYVLAYHTDRRARDLRLRDLVFEQSENERLAQLVADRNQRKRGQALWRDVRDTAEIDRVGDQAGPVDGNRSRRAGADEIRSAGAHVAGVIQFSK